MSNEEIEMEKNEDPKSANRFSDDGMETEIEVKKGDEENQKQKKKYKKKSSPKSSESSENLPDTPPPEYQSEAEIAEDDSKEEQSKKKTMKNNLKNMRSTPLILAHALLVCVFLPMGIYACDVILSVNVLQRDALWSAVINDENDFSLLPKPVTVTGNKYEMSNTLLITIQINSELEAENNKRFRRQVLVDASNSSEAETPELSTTVATTVAKATETTSSETGTTTVKGTAETNSMAVTTSPRVNDTSATIKVTSAKSNENETNKPTTKPTITTTSETTTSDGGEEVIETTAEVVTEEPKYWGKQPGEFCEGLDYFYEIHIAQANTSKTDWFDTQVQTLRNKQQTLFFMFTVFGFIFMLASIAMRSEIFLNEEWSSYIIFPFMLYAISMAVTASVFAQENVSGGLRCCVCRFTQNCSDIDPWNWRTHWPKVPDNDTWSLVAFISFILKLVDCFLIGAATLSFITNFSEDKWWKSLLKIVGWMIFFPILIFAPMLGVFRYQVLPGTSPDDSSTKVAVEVFFYIGVALWAFTLTALPIFCKFRMCNKTRQEAEEDIEDEYYD